MSRSRGCLLTLFQKSRIITRSGTLYRRPLIRTSSTATLVGIVGIVSGWLTSMLPLLNCLGFVISIGRAFCLGIRRLGC